MPFVPFLPSPSSVTAPSADFRCSSLPGPVADPLVSRVALACCCCCWPPEAFVAGPEVLVEVPEVLVEVPDDFGESPEVLDEDPDVLGVVPAAFASVTGGFTAGLGAASDDFDPGGAPRTRFSLTLGLVFGLPRGLTTATG